MISHRRVWQPSALAVFATPKAANCRTHPLRNHDLAAFEAERHRLAPVDDIPFWIKTGPVGSRPDPSAQFLGHPVRSLLRRRGGC